MDEKILKNLNLPFLSEVSHSSADEKLLDIYDKFLSSLTEYENYITADYQLFVMNENEAGGRLFSCLLQPDATLIKYYISLHISLDELPVEDERGKILRPFEVDFENFKMENLSAYMKDDAFRNDFLECCISCEVVGDVEEYLRALNGFESAPSFPEYQAFAKNRNKTHIDFDFDFIFDHIAASSMHIYAFMINDNWDMICVMHTGEYALPAVLGYIKRDNVANNFLLLNQAISVEGYPFVAGGFIHSWGDGLDISDQEFINEVIYDQNESILWQYLSPLTKTVRDNLYREANGYLHLKEYIRQLNELNDLDGSGLLIPLEELYERFGMPEGLDWYKNTIATIKNERQERDRLIEENKVSNLPIGEELYLRLLQWLDWMNNNGRPDDINENYTITGFVSKIKYLADALEGRGLAVINYLRERDDSASEELIENIYSVANSQYHRGPMSGLHNAPLRKLRNELNLNNNDE